MCRLTTLKVKGVRGVPIRRVFPVVTFIFVVSIVRSFPIVTDSSRFRPHEYRLQFSMIGP